MFRFCSYQLNNQGVGNYLSRFTLLAERFFLASPLACTLSFGCLVFRVPAVNKPATRNTRHANDNVYSCFDKSCPKKRKSVRDNAERSSGKYSINFK